MLLKSIQKFSKSQNLSFKIKKTFSQQLNEHYDVVISGAGPVGCAVACALQKDQYFQEGNNKILLVDIFQPQPLEKVYEKITPDHRVVSLSPASQKFLQSVGAWDHMDSKRMGHVKKIQVWENGGKGYIQFDTRNNNTDYLNYILENNHIQGALMKELLEQQRVDMVFGDSIEHYERNSDKGNALEITLKSGQKVTTDLIIGSEGRGSNVRKLSKIGGYGWDYNQKGIVCSIKLGAVENNQSYQRYLQSGPLAILPLWDEYCSIVWSAKGEDADYLLSLDDKMFMNELNWALTSKSKQETPVFDFDFSSQRTESFYFSPMVTEICNKRLSFPLIQQQAQHYVTDGVALVGDAAHAIHPQGGQGLNNGLLDAVGISNNIIQNIRSGNNIGQEISLKNYEIEAKSWNYLTAGAMEFFQQIYSINDKNMVFLRNMGVSLLNNIKPLKTAVQESAAHNPFEPKEYLWEKQQQ